MKRSAKTSARTQLHSRSNGETIQSYDMNLKLLRSCAPTVHGLGESMLDRLKEKDSGNSRRQIQGFKIAVRDEIDDHC